MTNFFSVGRAAQNPVFAREDFPHDTAALQAALDRCAQEDIPELRLCPASDWTLAPGGQSLILRSNLTLDAQGSTLTLVPYAGSGANPVGIRNAAGAKQITIRNLIGDGNAAQMRGEAKAGGCFWSFAGADVTLENVRIEQSVRYNSFVATRASRVLSGQIALRMNSREVEGVRTKFLAELRPGQRIRTGAGHLTFPVVEIISDTRLRLAYNFPYLDEPASSGCRLVQGVKVRATDCVFGPTLRDDKFGGGGWDESYFLRCKFLGDGEKSGYGFGATGMYASILEDCEALGVASGFGLERVAGCHFVRCTARGNHSKGWSIVNGCQDNEFVECEAYENADGFYDATFSKTHGQNIHNRYVRTRAHDNARHGMYFGGSRDPELHACTLKNNHRDPGTHAIGRNLVCKALSGYPASQPNIDAETEIALDT